MQSISVPAKAHLGDVSVLSTRVQACDIDDLSKLERLLGNRAGTLDRMSVGDTASWKSYSRCVITLGEVGPVFEKSAIQKIVTKSSTEWELVCLSDNASQTLHLQNFVTVQRYEVGQALGKLTTRKVCRNLSVLTTLVDDDKERQVVSTFGSNNKILYGSMQQKFTKKSLSCFA